MADGTAQACHSGVVTALSLNMSVSHCLRMKINTSGLTSAVATLQSPYYGITQCVFMFVAGFLWINRSISCSASCGSECWIRFLQHLPYWIPNTLGLSACVKLCLFASRFLHLAWELCISLQRSPGSYNVGALSQTPTTPCTAFRFERLAVGGVHYPSGLCPAAPLQCLACTVISTPLVCPGTQWTLKIIWV